MRHQDFGIGTEFRTAAGRWRCTDVGRRVIVAIKLDERDPTWFEGPPYAVPEVVFDEEDLNGCTLYLTDVGAPLGSPSGTGERSVDRSVIAGVDGCPGGWVAAIRDRDGAIRFHVFRDFGALVDEVEVGRIGHVIIDIPIGLMDDAPRWVDRAAKRFLRERHVCVFIAPLRPMLGVSAEEASAVRKMRLGGWASVQELAILPKVAEVDARMSPGLQARIREGHPEVTAAILNGGAPLNAKKRHADGRRARLDLLAPVLGRALDGVLVTDRGGVPTPVPVQGAKPDDLVDALLLLASAVRLERGHACTLPLGEPPEVDSRGLVAEMVA